MAAELNTDATPKDVLAFISSLPAANAPGADWFNPESVAKVKEQIKEWEVTNARPDDDEPPTE